MLLHKWIKLKNNEAEGNLKRVSAVSLVSLPKEKETLRREGMFILNLLKKFQVNFI